MQANSYPKRKDHSTDAITTLSCISVYHRLILIRPARRSLTNSPQLSNFFYLFIAEHPVTSGLVSTGHESLHVHAE